MKSSVRQIHVSESDSAHFLRVDWEGRSLGSGFQLLLTDGQEAWRGEVDEAALRLEAEELEMQMQRYVVDLQEALTGTESCDSYRFSLKPHHSQSVAVTLTYEKMQEDISFRLGSVVMTTVSQPADAVKELLLQNLRRGNDLRETNRKLQEENERLRREHQRISAELKRYAAGKEALEAELVLNGSSIVLNEKKAKIRSLQKAVDNLQERTSDKGQTRRVDESRKEPMSTKEPPTKNRSR
ncbi:LOW QUALITY PROTEIN: DNA repair protein XRCC4 [Gouania willdenowi]|uniref:LOW QUALITY PROTEIN: DNA repair protein XRCC4 n=1 Tax=Gouania willdenowi TaxID=441366 RepID=UPI001056698B|nr:LOW QUALITY PROTEIN: DNA repair protein XRCC4-like [Gouania willdenowi]